MAKIRTLDDLKEIREKTMDLTGARSQGRTRVIVGMGTCGIAAGARAVMEAVMDELARQGIRDVSVETTGCIGMCQQEPLLDVIRQGQPRITYGKVSPEEARRIVAEHVVHGRLVEDKVIGQTD
ncbi:(2Fe-2S) ferredoxin domain-containing protein [Aminithiophilus ramosus]|uniref:(2Fe-2S) ferredoxin domain-containing protein n=2 Tax=Synergistales TaxID=649776 RepID=A0A9Q7AQZ5_9BACT|nr:(2Fe-2S) ferredoxin domain-containing protein [Aminithiophilus ramosus]QTX32421.1 (2Fe-2S) ferredoxin domain-containing protein [Aminithiophilus ramosus]QVL36298.1 (2Fe-2S) ferredoxin domain-containing protein [Synergistota bacterium]